MRILFNQGIPVPLRHALVGHQVATAYEKGWSALENGALLAKANEEFELFITTDRNLRYQQNLTSRRLAANNELSKITEDRGQDSADG